MALVYYTRSQLLFQENFYLFLVKMGHNFGSRYAIKAINHSKNSDDVPDSKKTALWFGIQGQITSAKNVRYYDAIHREPPTQKEFFFFKSELQDLLNPLRI